MKSSAENWVWWKHGVIYHIYTRSFLDTNGDGIGDLQGVIQKLDYLQDLGVDGIWLSPIYPSPMKDVGYDISNYRDIDPEYGTLADFRTLLTEAHARGIRVIMDLVMNHTSNQHPWFKEAKSSKDHPKRDWYIWKNVGKNGPPNNWKSTFGGSAWEWDENSQQYYLHSFLKEQPDLNWRNKDLIKTFFEEITFWLEMGVDGFRLDVINLIAKDKKFRNNPGWLPWLNIKNQIFTRNRGRSYKIVNKLRKLVDTYEERMLVGEIFISPPGDSSVAASYLGSGSNMLHMAFDFSLIFRRWNAQAYYKVIENWYDHIPKKGWACNVLSNHDLYRSYNRMGIGWDKAEKARVMAVLLLTLKGTPFIYYGEEIGMENIRLSKKEIVDPLGKKFWPIFSGRDRARSPMQWSEDHNAGFSIGTPWLPLSKNYPINNVVGQQADPESLWQLYKKLIKLRHDYPVLQHGKWQPVQKGKNGIIAYYRKRKNDKLLVVLNFTNQKKRLQLKGNKTWTSILSTHLTTSRVLNGEIELDRYEGLICI